MTPTFPSGCAHCLDISMLGAHLLKAGFVTADSKSGVTSAVGKFFMATMQVTALMNSNSNCNFT